jgi:putative MATE family efflux protein
MLLAIQTQIQQGFLRKLCWIALPIAFQMMLFSSRSLVDIVMLGQLTEADVAAIGIAGKALFVMTIMIIGLTSAGGLLTSQYWGANNPKGVQESTALTVSITLVFAVLNAAIFLIFPDEIMGLATKDAEVLGLGKQYLQITGLSLFAVAVGASVSVGLRSMHQPMISTIFSAIGIALNVGLNAIFIFGWGSLNIPAMGIAGAAWATLFSGVIEVALLLGYLHWKRHLLAIRMAVYQAVFQWNRWWRFLKLALPIGSNAFAWSLGMFVYHAVIGQQGIDGLVALSVLAPIESFALALLLGLSSASAVLIGNEIGGNRLPSAFVQSWIVLGFGFVCALGIVAIMLVLRVPIFSMFSALDGETLSITNDFFLILCGILLIKTFPLIIINGVLRAGGDIKYCFYQDILCQWGIGIPLMIFAAWLGTWSLPMLYALLAVEDIVKGFGSIWRMKSKRWMNNLTEGSL